MKLVNEYIDRKPDAKVLIGVEGYFPLPYYLRNRARNLAYLKTDKPEDYAKDYDIMIMNFHKTRWTDPAWVWKYNRLSDYAEASTFYRNLDGFPPPDAPGTAPKR